MSPQFAVGDCVAYSAKWLRSMGLKGRKEGLMRAIVTAVYADSGIIEFITDDGVESGGLASNFVLDIPRDICVDATRNS